MLRRYSASKSFSHVSFFNEFVARRPLFVVSLQYKVGLDEVNKHLQLHRAFLEKCYQQKIFIISGRKVPRTGGVIIASARNQAALESILESDPFKKHGIADYQITEFVPTMYDFELTNVVKRDTENKEGLNFK